MESVIQIKLHQAVLFIERTPYQLRMLFNMCWASTSWKQQRFCSFYCIGRLVKEYQKCLLGSLSFLQFSILLVKIQQECDSIFVYVCVHTNALKEMLCILMVLCRGQLCMVKINLQGHAGTLHKCHVSKVLTCILGGSLGMPLYLVNRANVTTVQKV